MWFAKYIGIPFLELGRTRAGADCWGLVRMVYQNELGILLPEWSAHSSSFDNAVVATEIKEAHEYFTRVEQPEPFAVAWFSSKSVYAHVGIAVDSQRMLHCTAGKDSCIESWQTRINLLKGFYLPNDQSNRPAQPV
jgi:cell wall-associated NlpC family hydrolase